MRKQIVLSLLVAFMISLTFSGCDEVLSPLLPLEKNEVRAHVPDYGEFDSKPVTVINAGSHFVIQAPIKGTDNQDTIVITLDIPLQTTAPYTITVQNDDVALIEYCVLQPSGVCVVYHAKKGLGSGTITVSEITVEGSNKVIQGTFSASVLPISGSGSGKTISSGEFRIVL